MVRTLLDQLGDDVVAAHPRPVDVEVPADAHRQVRRGAEAAQLLARHLAEGVRGARGGKVGKDEGGVLGDRRFGQARGHRAVAHLAGGAQEQPLRPLAGAPVEHVERREHIGPQDPSGGFQAVADTDHGGEVVHLGGTAGKEPGGDGPGEVVRHERGVPAQPFHRGVVAAAGEVVHQRHGHPVVEQAAGEVHPDEADAPGDDGSLSHGPASGRRHPGRKPLPGRPARPRCRRPPPAAAAWTTAWRDQGRGSRDGR